MHYGFVNCAKKCFHRFSEKGFQKIEKKNSVIFLKILYQIFCKNIFPKGKS